MRSPRIDQFPGNQAWIAIVAISAASSAWGCSASDGGGESPSDATSDAGAISEIDGAISEIAPGADSLAADTDSTTIDSGTIDSATTAEGGSSDVAVDSAPPSDSGLVIEFVSTDRALFEVTNPKGTVTFGAKDPLARDGNVADLLVRGGLAITTPAGASEIGTKAMYSYGTYRFRVRLATCAKTEELVNGLFLYANDGKDHDGDGIVDNPELDIEILCGQPGFLNLTSWTEYTDDTHMRKQSRIVDLDTGTVYIGKIDGYGYDLSDPRTGKIDPALAHPGWYDPKAFYEMGYAWSATAVRFFIVLGGKELTLWTTEDPTRVPHSPMAMRFNLWHPSDHWNESGTAAPAAKDATLSIDWLRIDR